MQLQQCRTDVVAYKPRTRDALRHSVLVEVERLLTTGGRQALNCNTNVNTVTQPPALPLAPLNRLLCRNRNVFWLIGWFKKLISVINGHYGPQSLSSLTSDFVIIDVDRFTLDIICIQCSPECLRQTPSVVQYHQLQIQIPGHLCIPRTQNTKHLAK